MNSQKTKIKERSTLNGKLSYTCSPPQYGSEIIVRCGRAKDSGNVAKQDLVGMIESSNTWAHSCCDCMYSHNQASQNPNTNGGGIHEVPPLAKEINLYKNAVPKKKLSMFQ